MGENQETAALDCYLEIWKQASEMAKVVMIASRGGVLEVGRVDLCTDGFYYKEKCIIRLLQKY